MLQMHQPSTPASGAGCASCCRAGLWAGGTTRSGPRPRRASGLMGRNVTMERRRRASDCFNGKEYERAETSFTMCPCDTVGAPPDVSTLHTNMGLATEPEAGLCATCKLNHDRARWGLAPTRQAISSHFLIGDSDRAICLHASRVLKDVQQSPHRAALEQAR